jgi:hypothetical protein
VGTNNVRTDIVIDLIMGIVILILGLTTNNFLFLLTALIPVLVVIGTWGEKTNRVVQVAVIIVSFAVIIGGEGIFDCLPLYIMWTVDLCRILCRFKL